MDAAEKVLENLKKKGNLNCFSCWEKTLNNQIIDVRTTALSKHCCRNFVNCDLYFQTNEKQNTTLKFKQTGEMKNLKSSLQNKTKATKHLNGEKEGVAVEKNPSAIIKR